MITLFENEDFILKSTEHDYDFVGFIEQKTEKPLTFFFEEVLVPTDEDDEDCEFEVVESETQLAGYWEGPDISKKNDGTDEVEDLAFRLGATSWLTMDDDKSAGFLSEPQQRGWFLALIKNFCPEQLSKISWV